MSSRNKILIKDRSVFNQVYEVHWFMLYQIALRKTGSRESAMDIIQDLFVHLWDARHRLSISEDIRFYLLKCLHNRLLNHFRDQGVREKHYRLFAETLAELDESLQQQLALKDLRAFIDGEIRKMPKKMRQVYLLSREGQLSTREIADKLSISPQTVKNQVSTALKRLKTAVKEYPADYTLTFALGWWLF